MSSNLWIATDFSLPLGCPALNGVVVAVLVRPLPGAL
jgi:hypothetical protein